MIKKSLNLVKTVFGNVEPKLENNKKEEPVGTYIVDVLAKIIMFQKKRPLNQDDVKRNKRIDAMLKRQATPSAKKLKELKNEIALKIALQKGKRKPIGVSYDRKDIKARKLAQRERITG